MSVCGMVCQTRNLLVIYQNKMRWERSASKAGALAALIISFFIMIIFNFECTYSRFPVNLSTVTLCSLYLCARPFNYK